jgi:hypothetical protein
MKSKFSIPFVIIILAIGIVLGTQLDKIFSGDNLNGSIEKLDDVLTYTQ